MAKIFFAFIFFLISTKTVLGGVAIRQEFPPARVFSNFGAMISYFINIAIGISFIVSLFLMIFAGFRWITSGGDPKNIEGARNQLTYAIVGLVVVIISFFLIVLAENIFQLDLIL